MGRPARNSGGTGGHGCVPLPGDRPNFNHHILSDQQLLSLVNVSYKKAQSRIHKKFSNEDGTSRNNQDYSQLGQKRMNNKKKFLQGASLVKFSSSSRPAVNIGCPSKSEAPFIDVSVPTVKMPMSSTRSELTPKPRVVLSRPSVSKMSEFSNGSQSAEPVVQVGSLSNAEASSKDATDLSAKLPVPSVKMPLSSAGSELTSQPLVGVSRPSVMKDDSSSKVSECSRQVAVPSKANSTKVKPVKDSIEKLLPSEVMMSLADQLPSDTKYVRSQSSADSSKQVSRFANDMSFAVSKLPNLNRTGMSVSRSEIQMPTFAFPASPVEMPVSSCEQHASSAQPFISLSGPPPENPLNSNQTVPFSNHHTSSFFMYGGMLYNAACLESKPFWPSVQTKCDFNQTYNQYSSGLHIHHQTSQEEMVNQTYNQPSSCSTNFLPTYSADQDDGRDAESDEKHTRKEALDE